MKGRARNKLTAYQYVKEVQLYKSIKRPHCGAVAVESAAAAAQDDD